MQVDDHGFIKIDGQRRTAVPHIFAVGDMAGQPMLAHKASHEARIAVEVIAGKNVVYEPAAIPAVVFTETIKEAAEIYHGTATHVYRPKRKKGKDG